jgi:predicted nucleic acid-binding protein
VTTYIDSSVLVAIYVPERFSNAARRTVRGVSQVPFTQLHELELPNAFELLLGRGSISREECRAVHTQLQEDLESQRLGRVSLDLDHVFSSASDLSRTYSARFVTRSLDLLHVAAARVMRCSTFASADDRQLAVAKATGLKVVDIKRRARQNRDEGVTLGSVGNRPFLRRRGVRYPRSLS